MAVVVDSVVAIRTSLSVCRNTDSFKFFSPAASVIHHCWFVLLTESSVRIELVHAYFCWLTNTSMFMSWSFYKNVTHEKQLIIRSPVISKRCNMLLKRVVLSSVVDEQEGHKVTNPEDSYTLLWALRSRVLLVSSLLNVHHTQR